MPTTSLQNNPIVIGTPIEIEAAVNEVRLLLAGLTWVDKPYFIAQRFYRKEGERVFYYPETYAPIPPIAPATTNVPNYARLTPDNDYKGMFFFMVGTGRNAFDSPKQNYITYPVSIIFSVNLKLIDPVKLTNGLFTQELIKQARRLLTVSRPNYSFGYVLKTETRDLRECYKEFSLQDLETYNRAPLQCFRFDLDMTILEDC